MPRTIDQLTAVKVAKLKSPGMYPDGAGLYLQIIGDPKKGALAKSWIFRFSLRGRARQMGLGSAIGSQQRAAVTLAEARTKATECRKLLAEFKDPIDERDRQREQAALTEQRTVTFKEAAEAYIVAHRAGWKNIKHAAQWPATLIAYAYPTIGAIAVRDIDTALVLKVVQPIWQTKPETANRLRGRIEQILDSAKALNQRSGENPARWKGNLDHLLPARSKVRKIKHHAALPYDELSAFLAALREQDGVAARALEFTILTAARTGETIGAEADEIDDDDKVWIVPGERMKAGNEHRVPLSARTLAIIKALAPLRDERGLLFPGRGDGKPLSNMAMLMLLERMGRDDLTVHGFRSTFRDWAAECTNFPNEVVEMALAHVVDDKTEAAYRRGDLFEKRRKLMDAWARFCTTAPQKREAVVVPMRLSAT